MWTVVDTLRRKLKLCSMKKLFYRESGPDCCCLVLTEPIEPAPEPASEPAIRVRRRFDGPREGSPLPVGRLSFAEVCLFSLLYMCTCRIGRFAGCACQECPAICTSLLYSRRPNSHHGCLGPRVPPFDSALHGPHKAHPPLGARARCKTGQTVARAACRGCWAVRAVRSACFST